MLSHTSAHFLHAGQYRFFAVRFLKECTLLLFLLVISVVTFAQDIPSRRGSSIVDDTTKQIYGPKTSRYFYEQEVFYNREKLNRIDTAINNFHRWNFVQRYNNLYQDLGNIGTAIRPIYYQPPDVIGAHSGAHVYDLYWDSEPMRYFDTKSPYTNMKIILGGKGRSLTRATYSRNINPRWNFGFDYRSLYIDKQVLRATKGDRQTRENYYDAFMTYQSKDSAYRVFTNFRRSFHRVVESGGVKPEDLDSFVYKEFFDVNAQPWFAHDESNDLRMNFHLHQQYKVGKALQVYQTFDRYRQQNKFLDVKNPLTGQYYDQTVIPKDSANDVTKFKAFRTEVGIKGNISKIFYNGYYAIRHYSMTYNTLRNFDVRGDSLPHMTYDTLRSIGLRNIGNESYLGGRIALHLDSIGDVSGGIEFQKDTAKLIGNYKIYGQIQSRWFEARIQQSQYAPGFMEQVYRGAHDQWANKFSPIQSTQINGYVHYRSVAVRLSPGLTFTRLGNYVFYKSLSDVDTLRNIRPVQSSGSQVIASPEVRVGFTFFKHVTLNSQVIYTELLKNSDDAIQVPPLFVNAQLAYANIFFHGNFDMQAGVDVHWNSAYYAPGYDPAIRQFYVQKTVQVPAVPIVDLFLNAKIKRGRIFFKYHNLNMIFTHTGYMPTPYYPGQRNIMDFGFDWSFYD